MGLGDLLGGAGSLVQVILGVGLLIFIHEAGHFFAAKWAGVKVLAFSLGFGPELFGITRGPTRYRVGWVPLGGYVKMSGEVERPEGGFAPDDYPSAPVWKRSIIIGAGVVMNAVLGFLLFTIALLWGMPGDPVSVQVQSGSPAWEAGIRSGDRVLEAGGHRVVEFSDIVYATFSDGPVDLEIERHGRRRRVLVERPEVDGRVKPQIGVGPGMGELLEVAEGSRAAAAGLQSGDRIESVQGVPASLGDFLDPVFQQAVVPPWGPLEIVVRRGTESVKVALEPAKDAARIGIASLRTTVKAVRPGGIAHDAGWRDGDRPKEVGEGKVRGQASFFRAAMRAPAGSAVRVEREGAIVSLPLPDSPADRLETLRDLHFEIGESSTAVEVAAEAPPGADGLPRPSPAEAAGIPNGARITSVNGVKVASFEQVSQRVAAADGEELEIAWDEAGKERRVRVKPVPHPVHALDVGSRPEGVVRASSPVDAVGMAAHRCVRTTRNIFATLQGLFTGSVEKGAVGGPVLIVQATLHNARQGFGWFLWILAVLSINLMFLNVLPIPLLDGGQLALLLLEGVTRRRPSDAVVGITQMAGLVFLLGVLLLVTFNDIKRLVGG